MFKPPTSTLTFLLILLVNVLPLSVQIIFPLLILNLSAWIVGADAEFPVSNLAIISPNGFTVTISRNPHCLGT